MTVPERKTAKNRLHPDLKVSGGRQVDQAVRRERIERKVAEVVAAGATVQARLLVGEHLDHVMLTDPEGNEFCVV
ncbi:VOC family protein [Microlunatus sp. GCM10028923]|uniref:VOC family protein n=1 Tax=Microlunatus sp. GCM10028923 TaxID=3273400 RepID=UPI0036193290